MTKNKQLDELIAQLEAQMNSEKLDDFLGLSPAQMYVLLYGSLKDIEPILSFNRDFDPSLLIGAPVVAQASLLIKLIGEAGEAKATQNGFLPRKIVQALSEPYPVPGYSARSEEYEPGIQALRFAVTACGWMKKKNRKFSLTKKGMQIFERGFTVDHYVVLLQYWLRTYLWSFPDHYPEYRFIQQAAIFSLYILRQEARELMPCRRLADLFLRAFPDSLDMITEELFFGRTRQDQLASIITLRFVQRFAAYFGLVDYRKDRELPFFEREEKAQVVITKLFSEALCWFSTNKPTAERMPDDSDGLIWH